MTDSWVERGASGHGGAVPPTLAGEPLAAPVRAAWAGRSPPGKQAYGAALSPYAEQVMRIHRQTTEIATGKTSEEVVYAITRLPVEEADEARLSSLVRGHWSVEALHGIRDGTFGEDQSRVPTKNAPRAMASLRNLAIRLHALMSYRTAAQGSRRLRSRTEETMKRLSLSVA